MVVKKYFKKNWFGMYVKFWYWSIKKLKYIYQFDAFFWTGWFYKTYFDSLVRMILDDSIWFYFNFDSLTILKSWLNQIYFQFPIQSIEPTNTIFKTLEYDTNK